VAAVAADIDRQGLLSRAQPVLVAVSGGADSVALLSVLRELAGGAGRAYRLTAAHLDHGLRDGSADDARFVAELAQQYGIACVSRRIDVAAVAGREGMGVEEAARQVRYAFLGEAAKAAGATAVALGHHADDNAETVLHRIVRGTHLRGLAGMPARRRLAEGVELVRPLLSARREQIEAFCRRRGLSWRTDPTNADTSYHRNFIRHELLPLLRARLNDRVDEALVRLAAAAAEAEGQLAEQGAAAERGARRSAEAGLVALDLAALAAEPAVLRRYAVRHALESLNAPMGRITAEHLHDVARLISAEPGASPVSLPGELVARREGAVLVLGPLGRPEPRREWKVALACPGRTALPDGRTVLCERLPFDEGAFRRHRAGPRPGVEMLDAGRLCGELSCRPRRDGDAFVPLGAGGRQTVGDFLTNLKASQELRRRALCVEDEEGIVYLAPLRIADRAGVGPSTRTVLRIEVRCEAAGPDP